MTSADLARLIALAEAATKEQWTTSYTIDPSDDSGYRCGYAVCGPSDGESVYVGYEEDAAFIAAANPSTVVALCQALLTAREDLQRARALLGEARAERDEWKRRAASHGCDTEKGDPDCG